MALSAARNPTFECVPSQKGFFVDAPQRHSAMVSFSTGNPPNALVLEKIERALTEAGLPPLGWYDVLVELARAPGGRLRMHELARAVVLSRSGLTRLVDRLEGAGLLRREPDPADRRGSYAAITENGRATLRRMWPVYAAGIAEHFARHLGDDEARVIASALGRVAEAARVR